MNKGLLLFGVTASVSKYISYNVSMCSVNLSGSRAVLLLVRPVIHRHGKACCSVNEIPSCPQEYCLPGLQCVQVYDGDEWEAVR